MKRDRDVGSSRGQSQKLQLYLLGELSRNQLRGLPVLFYQRPRPKLPSTHINSFSVPVSSEGRVEVLGGASLQISNLTEDDAGVYTCMAEDANGTIEAQAQLTVQGTCRQEAFMITEPLNPLWISNA